MAEVPVVNDDELVEALRELGRRPKAPVAMANIPEQSRELPMAHVTEHPMRAIESALQEGAKAPNVGSLCATLASPLVLAIKSLIDVVRGITVLAPDVAAIALSVTGLVIGGVAALLLCAKWYGEQKPSKLQELAMRHVKECLDEMRRIDRTTEPPPPP